MTIKDDKGKKLANPKFWDKAYERTGIRVRDTHQLCKDISENDFCSKTLGSDISLDLDRMVSAGQSYGGISAIAAAIDD